jgi:tRNA (cmo5U34)-methyltransferase
MEDNNSPQSNRMVREQFNRVAQRYDSVRRKLIPCYDDFYASAVAAAVTDNSAPNVLDIGAGTGILSARIRDRYPLCKLVLADIAEKMLEVAKERFNSVEGVAYITGDYSKLDLGSDYDLVVSALSIHHLEDVNKKKIFHRIYKVLAPDGAFVNADQCLGATPELEQLNRCVWMDNIDKSGLSAEEIKAAQERLKLDKMAKLEDQMNWLRNVGFVDVGVVYKWFPFTVFTARKRG